ncbi:putative lipoprotein [Mycoplasma testudineum]|uniref:Putative lipoprotein n=1 Tax=Mycoplasma testudineum TaxID=244584 RepID=A0A4R6IFH0_9MOLU|nr:hypothetical protein [Mycoplasma testudineum]OYD26889.1 hypothetical protein CG473_00935 [Mycoplasma testudineum]TDO20438.1 putative lipoprotein [Mycoplasma testudineum]
MKIKNIFKQFALPFAAISTAAMAISCSSNNPSTAKFDTVNDGKIVLQTAQQEFFPMFKALKKVVDFYNEQQKNIDGFIPVVLNSRNNLNVTTEAELITKITNSIRAKDVNNIPNLVMANKSLTQPLFANGMLLDLTNSKITKEIFTDTMYHYENDLPGINLDNSKIYNIPYSLINSDNMVFNLDAMAHIFREIKKNGATIDTNSNIYKKVAEVNQNLLENPDSSDFKPANDNYDWGSSNGIVDSTTFLDLTINDSTFDSFKNSTDFANRVRNSLTPLQGKKLPNIGGIDYAWILFSKVMLKLNNYSNNDYLWKIDNTGRTVFNFIGNSDIAKSNQEKIKQAFNTIIGEWSYEDANKEAAFRITQTGERGDATPWLIRDNLMAFSYGPNVEYSHSVFSSASLKDFNSDGRANIDAWLKRDEVYWKNQLFKIEETDTQGGFVPDGSSLLAIHANEIENKGTIKFLEWLFTGNLIDENNQSIKVTNYLMKNSGYVIGTKEAISDETVDFFKKELSTIENGNSFLKTKSINESETSFDDRLGFTNPIDEETWYSINSVQRTIEDLSKNNSMSNISHLVSINSNTALSSITNTMVNYLTNAQKNKQLNAETFLDTLIRIAREL